jgi:hypothetical protein
MRSSSHRGASPWKLGQKVFIVGGVSKQSRREHWQKYNAYNKETHKYVDVGSDRWCSVDHLDADVPRATLPYAPPETNMMSSRESHPWQATADTPLEYAPTHRQSIRFDQINTPLPRTCTTTRGKNLQWREKCTCIRDYMGYIVKTNRIKSNIFTQLIARYYYM